MLHLSPEAYRRMPWRNGLGVTREIVRIDGADGEIDWRVSVAEVTADGPFSRFPGYDRVIVTIEGAGMVLAHPALGRSVRLGPWAPYAFDGAWETSCALLDGPVRDFNLMTRRGRLVGDVAVVRVAAGGSSELPFGAHLLHCLAGRCFAHGGVGARLALSAGETAVSEGDGDEVREVAAREGAVIAIAVSVRATE